MWYRICGTIQPTISLIGEHPGKLEVFKWCVIKQSCIGDELLVVPKQQHLLSPKLSFVELHEISATNSARYRFEGRGGLFWTIRHWVYWFAFSHWHAHSTEIHVQVIWPTSLLSKSGGQEMPVAASSPLLLGSSWWQQMSSRDSPQTFAYFSFYKC